MNKRGRRSDSVDEFVDAWGAMGPLFGMSTSVARVHGLLIASADPFCLDDIADRLAISKGNVSGCLKELRGYGVIRKVVVRDDRREHYTSQNDIWKMLFDIVRERKRRAIDPAVETVRHAVGRALESRDAVAADRLRQLEQMLATFDTIALRVLATVDRAKALIGLLGDAP